MERGRERKATDFRQRWKPGEGGGIERLQTD
jgi:hypothetical protein